MTCVRGRNDQLVWVAGRLYACRSCAIARNNCAGRLQTWDIEYNSAGDQHQGEEGGDNDDEPPMTPGLWPYYRAFVPLT
jgi:hypothetical protein